MLTFKNGKEEDQVHEEVNLSHETVVPDVLPDLVSEGDDSNKDLLTFGAYRYEQEGESSENRAWNNLARAADRKMVLTGVLSGTEPTSNGEKVMIIDYMGARVVIPEREMVLTEWPDDEEVPILVRRHLGRMLGATISFIPLAVDVENQAAVGSRKAAMREQQKVYYASGRIHPGMLLRCRVMGVGNNAVTVEAGGVESVINAREVSYEWFPDITDLYGAGDSVNVRVLEVTHDEERDLYSAQFSIKQAGTNTGLIALKKLSADSNYFGEVTGVNNGTIFVRLKAGCNAKTRLYRCADEPQKFDTVCFRVREIDEEKCVALGLITRVISHHNKMQ